MIATTVNICHCRIIILPNIRDSCVTGCVENLLFPPYSILNVKRNNELSLNTVHNSHFLNTPVVSVVELSDRLNIKRKELLYFGHRYRQLEINGFSCGEND